MLVLDVVVEAKLVLLSGGPWRACLSFSFEQLASHDFVALRRAGEFHRSSYKVETVPRRTQ